jgi:NADPH:quinone reductase-like Zn-dependent oxidoreductase
MKPIKQRGYGPPEVYRQGEIETPLIGDDEVLVRVRAASVNVRDVGGAPAVAE